VPEGCVLFVYVNGVLIVKVGAKNLGSGRDQKVRGIPGVVETEFIPVFKT